MRRSSPSASFCECGDHAFANLTKGYVALVSPEIAPAAPSRQSSIGRPAGSSLGRAATLNHSERQRSSGTALGLRWGMYRTTCAVGTTGGRCARLGCISGSLPLSDLPDYHLAGRFGVRSFSALSQFNGIGRRSTALQAILIQSRRERAFQALRAALRSMVGLHNRSRTEGSDE